jgi:hypothetical protein
MLVDAPKVLIDSSIRWCTLAAAGSISFLHCTGMLATLERVTRRACFHDELGWWCPLCHLAMDHGAPIIFVKLALRRLRWLRVNVYGYFLRYFHTWFYVMAESFIIGHVTRVPSSCCSTVPTTERSCALMTERREHLDYLHFEPCSDLFDSVLKTIFSDSFLNRKGPTGVRSQETLVSLLCIKIRCLTLIHNAPRRLHFGFDHGMTRVLSGSGPMLALPAESIATTRMQ